MLSRNNWSTPRDLDPTPDSELNALAASVALGAPRASRLMALVRLLLMVGPALWIAHSVDVGGAARRLASASLVTVLAAFAVVFAGLFIGVLRFRLLLDAWDEARGPRISALLRDTLVGLYVGLLPGAVGGDVARAWRVRRAAGGMASALLVAVVDRLCGLLGLLALGALAGALGAGSPDARLAQLSRWTWLLATTLSILLALGLWLIARSPRLRALLDRAPRPLRALAGLRPPRSRWRLLAALGSSLLTQGAVVVALVLVVLAVHPALELGPALAVAPWVVLLIFVPITPAGVGQRELVFVELWSLVGVPRNAALGASLLYLAIGLIYAALGGVFLLWERGRK